MPAAGSIVRAPGVGGREAARVSSRLEKAKALNIGNGLNETTGGGPVVSTPNTRPFVISRSALLSPRGTG